MSAEQDNAADVVRMAESAGWKVISAWINGRIETLTGRILAGESDIRVESVVKQKTGTKVNITVLNMTKDTDRHEIKTWKLLLGKISEFEKIAFEKR